MHAHAVEANVAPPAGLLVTKMRTPRLRDAASSRRRLLPYLCTDPAPLVVVTAAGGFGKSTAGESNEAIVHEARPLG